MNRSLFIMSIMNSNKKKEEEEIKTKVVTLGCCMFMHSYK